jgi:endoglucanase
LIGDFVNVNRLLKLASMVGISGNEDAVSDYLKTELENLNFTCEKDSFGNLFAHRNGSGKHLLLEAHIDQVGMMVSEIDSQGFIRFSPVGGIDLRILPSQEVFIHGKNITRGTICFHPSDDSENTDKAPSLNRLCIDTGLGVRVAEVVSVGDFISFNSAPFVQNGYVFGAALDNRASVEILLSCLEANETDLEVSVLFAVQEEIGHVGAVVAEPRINADLAIVLDVTFGQSHNDNKDTFVCGNGPAIGVGPSVSHKDALELIDVAKKTGVQHQIEVMGGSSGTDAWTMQLAGNGLPVLMVSLPIRYMHTPVEQFDLQDAAAAVTLLNAYFKRCAQ